MPQTIDITTRWTAGPPPVPDTGDSWRILRFDSYTNKIVEEWVCCYCPSSADWHIFGDPDNWISAKRILAHAPAGVSPELERWAKEQSQ